MSWGQVVTLNKHTSHVLKNRTVCSHKHHNKTKQAEGVVMCFWCMPWLICSLTFRTPFCALLKKFDIWLFWNCKGVILATCSILSLIHMVIITWHTVQWAHKDPSLSPGKPWIPHGTDPRKRVTDYNLTSVTGHNSDINDNRRHTVNIGCVFYKYAVCYLQYTLVTQ